MTNTISLVMAVYNGSKTIEATLNSVFNQSRAIDEIIIVDDGSTDQSFEVAHQILQSSPVNNFKVLHQENGKQGKARNYGLNYVTSSHVIFMDADDTWHPQLIETVHRNLEGVDVVFFGYQHVNENHEVLKVIHPDMTIDQAILDKSSHRFMVPASPCLHVAKVEFLKEHNITFLEGKFFEDIDYVIKLVSVAKVSKTIDFIGYNYLIHSKSTVRSGNIERNLDIIDVFDSSLKFLNQKGILQENYQAIKFLAIQYLYIDANIRVFASNASFSNKVNVYSEIKHYMDTNFKGYAHEKNQLKLPKSKQLLYFLLNIKALRLLSFMLERIQNARNS